MNEHVFVVRAVAKDGREVRRPRCVRKLGFAADARYRGISRILSLTLNSNVSS